MLKKKLKVIAGTLLAVVLISQLAIPYSLTPAFAQAKDSILKPVNSPPTNNSNDKKPDKDKPTKDNPKDKPKTEATQAKPKAELPDKKLNSGDSPLKIKPLKELKSQDRSSSSEKRYKHIKAAWVPKEIKASLDLLAVTMETSCDYIDMKGLKPNSKFYLLGKSGNVLLEGTAYSDGTAGVKDIFENWRRNNIAFFEGDVVDNRETCTITIKSEIKTKDSINGLKGVPIEVYYEDGTLATYGKTNEDGYFSGHVLVSQGEKLKVKQIVNKFQSDTNAILDTNELVISTDNRVGNNLVSPLVTFHNKEKAVTKSVTVYSVARTNKRSEGRPLAGVPIEIYYNNWKLAAAGVTKDDGTFQVNIDVFKGEDLYVKQIVDKAPSGLRAILEKDSLVIPFTWPDLYFFNKDISGDYDVTFNFQLPPNKKPLFDHSSFVFAYEVDNNNVDPRFLEVVTYNHFTRLLVGSQSLSAIERAHATHFMLASANNLPPGYYVESINGMDPETTFPNVPKEVTIKIGYKAAGELECIASIKIPNEKYSGCFEAGLLDEQGHVVISAVNDENGNFNFEKIKYTEKDVGEHKYQNYIKYTDKGLKLKGALGEIKSDESIPYVFPITVKDNGDGTLSLSTKNGLLSFPISNIRFVFSPAYLTPLLPVTGTPLTLLIISVLVFTTTLVVLTRNHSKVVEIKSKN